jgi:hypothetical protein
LKDDDSILVRFSKKVQRFQEFLHTLGEIESVEKHRVFGMVLALDAILQEESPA